MATSRQSAPVPARLSHLNGTVSLKRELKETAAIIYRSGACLFEDAYRYRDHAKALLWATIPHACIRRAQNVSRPMLWSPPRWDSCREAQTTIEGSALLRAGYKNRFFTACEGEDHPHKYTTQQTTLNTPHLDPSTSPKMACDSASCKCTSCTCQPGSCKCSSCNTKVHEKCSHEFRWAELTSL